MVTEIDLDALDEAIETFMEKLDKARLKEAYIHANLRNFYLEVADDDEIDEFIATGRDVSVDILEELDIKPVINCEWSNIKTPHPEYDVFLKE